MQVITNKNRNILFDFLRVVSIFWIVCFWHINDYCEVPFISIKFGSVITTIALSILFFISGLFIGRKDTYSYSEALKFNKKRIIRLYIPFFFASILLWFCNIPFPYYSSKHVFFYSLTGLSPFLGACPRTMWFVNVLLVYYFLTPFLKSEKLWNQLIKTICIFFLLYFVCLHIHGDRRMFCFFMPYAIGLSMPNSISNMGMDSFPKWITKIIGVLSYSSMMTYLLHRQVYCLSIRIGIPLYLAVAVLFFIAFGTQYIYDTIIDVIKSVFTKTNRVYHKCQSM